MKAHHGLLLFLVLVLQEGRAFVPVGTRLSSPLAPSFFSQANSEDVPVAVDDLSLLEGERRRGWIGSRIASRVACKCAGLASGFCGFVARGMAEDVEYAELPPPYVPALFGVILLAGVGVLTASLGDVMTEGMYIILLDCFQMQCLESSFSSLLFFW